MITRILLLLLLLIACASPAMAARIQLTNAESTGAPGKFASAEIRREAVASGMTIGEDAEATSITLSVDKDAKAAPQSYQIRVRNTGGRCVIEVAGADTVGAMYGGLDVAEAIRTGTLDSLKDYEKSPHIAKRGIKFNIPLDLRTPSYTDCSDAAGTLLLDLQLRDWSSELFQKLEIPNKWLPEVYEGSQITSELCSKVAAELGLLAGLPVVAGGGDNAVAAIGTGIVRSGLVSSSIGTSGVVFAL